MSDEAKRYPKTKYITSLNENRYKCQGSCCSCKFTSQYQAGNFTIAPYKHSQYKPGKKYTGV